MCRRVIFAVVVLTRSLLPALAHADLRKMSSAAIKEFLPVFRWKAQSSRPATKPAGLSRAYSFATSNRGRRAETASAFRKILRAGGRGCYKAQRRIRLDKKLTLRV